MPPYEVVHRDAEMTIATCGLVLVNAWHKAPSAAQLDKVRGVSESLVAAHGPYIPFSLIDASAGKSMPEESRKRAKEVAIAMGDRTLCQTLCFTGSGFFVAIARSITIGIQTVANPPFPWRVFSNVTEATSWTVETALTMHKVIDDDALRATVEMARMPPVKS